MPGELPDSSRRRDSLPQRSSRQRDGSPLPWYWQVAFVVAGVLLLLLGLVGVVLPVLPGVVFLLAGLLLLARVFHPLRRLAHRLPGMQQVDRRLERLGEMNWSARLQRVSRYVAGAVNRGVVALGQLLRRLLMRLLGRLLGRLSGRR